MSTGGEKVFSILGIHLPELENSKKLIFVELELELVNNLIRELELELGLAKIG